MSDLYADSHGPMDGAVRSVWAAPSVPGSLGSCVSYALSAGVPRTKSGEGHNPKIKL